MALPQRHRLKGKRVFDCVYQRGRKHHGPFLMVRILEARPVLLPVSQHHCPPSAWRCGVVVSNKVHKRSVQRNRLRRLIHRHLLALIPQDLPKSLWLLISLKPGSAERETAALLGECNQLLQQAGLTP